LKSELLSPLFGEYIPTNIYAVYGVPNVGKTLLAMTEVAALEAQGARILWIDTEGGLNFEDNSGIWGAWKPKLEARFGLKDLNENIEYHRVTDYVELMTWLNFPVEFEYGDGKPTIQPRKANKHLEGTVYENFGRKKDKTFIVLDSMSSVFRLQFGSMLQNFPGRGDATAYLIYAINRLMTRVNAPLLTTNHASLNPTNPYQMATMRGGSTVAYYSKNVLYLEKRKMQALDTFRKCWAVRSPGAKEWGASTWLKIETDKSFVSVTEADVEAAVQAAKAAKAARKAEESEE
jgi:RecA/RadA recombinase